MNSPLDTYKKEKNKSLLRQTTFDYFENKYISKSYIPQDFLETEERFAVRKLRFFIPGRIYTFSYDPLYKNFLDFYDKQPLLLVHSQFTAKNGNLILQGLNLNFLPEEQRVQTMELFWRTFKPDIESAEKSADEGQPGLLASAWKFLTNWHFTISIFNRQGNIGYQWAYRNYIIPRIVKPVIIELEDWYRIPYFIPKEFKGKSPAEVWGEYIKVRPELIKKQPNQILPNSRKYTPPGA